MVKPRDVDYTQVAHHYQAAVQQRLRSPIRHVQTAMGLLSYKVAKDSIKVCRDRGLLAEQAGTEELSVTIPVRWMTDPTSRALFLAALGAALSAPGPARISLHRHTTGVQPVAQAKAMGWQAGLQILGVELGRALVPAAPVRVTETPAVDPSGLETGSSHRADAATSREPIGASAP